MGQLWIGELRFGRDGLHKCEPRFDSGKGSLNHRKYHRLEQKWDEHPVV